MPDNRNAGIGGDLTFAALIDMLMNSGPEGRRRLLNAGIERDPRESTSEIDMAKLLPQFQNAEYGPKSSGVPYIFTGGSVFPRSEAQIRAGETAAKLAMLNNIMDAVGGILAARKQNA